MIALQQQPRAIQRTGQNALRRRTILAATRRLNRRAFFHSGGHLHSSDFDHVTEASRGERGPWFSRGEVQMQKFGPRFIAFLASVSMASNLLFGGTVRAADQPMTGTLNGA